MNVEAGRAWFRVALFIVVVSVGLLFVVQPGTAEFVVTVLTLSIGLVFVGIIAFLVRRGN